MGVADNLGEADASRMKDLEPQHLYSQISISMSCQPVNRRRWASLCGFRGVDSQDRKAVRTSLTTRFSRQQTLVHIGARARLGCVAMLSKTMDRDLANP